MYLDAVSVRERFTERDLAFIVDTLAASQQEGQSILSLMVQPEMADAILDNDKLAERLAQPGTLADVSAGFFLYVMVRRSLRQAGIDSRELADYLAGMLSRFMDQKQWQGSPMGDGSLDYEVDVQVAIQQAGAGQRYELHVYAGDRNLFLTGLQPRFIQRRSQRRGAPGVPYYENAGRCHYRSARDHPMAGAFAMRDTFDALATEFPRIRARLNHLAEEYFN